MNRSHTITWFVGVLFISGWMVYLSLQVVQLGQAIEQQQTIVQIEPVVIEREIVERDRPIFWNSLPTEMYRVTAYTNGVESTGKQPGDRNYGITRSGLPTKPGVCATDPDVIPLGSIVWVEGYGLCAALDTGSAIKGRKIDVWVEDVAEARQWGVKDQEVAVLR